MNSIEVINNTMNNVLIEVNEFKNYELDVENKILKIYFKDKRYIKIKLQVLDIENLIFNFKETIISKYDELRFFPPIFKTMYKVMLEYNGYKNHEDIKNLEIEKIYKPFLIGDTLNNEVYQGIQVTEGGYLLSFPLV